MENDYVIYESVTTYIVTLPNGSTFDIRRITNWNSLSSEQQAFLTAYLNNGLQKALAAYSIGISPTKVPVLRNQSFEFDEAIKEVETLYTEGLRSVHIAESFKNAKIRKGTLQALNAEGFELKQPQKVQNNLIVDGAGGLKQIINQIKATKEINL